MRRLIAYFALGATVLMGVGVAMSPTILNMDADLSYANGQTLYFKASRYNENTLLGNYDTFLDETDVYEIGTDGENTYVVEKIAETMRTRLDTWGISAYSVSTQGYDTIAVSLRTPGDKSLEYDQLKDYLSFSGGNLELDASNTVGSDEGEDGAYNHLSSWDTMLEGKTAKVENLDMDSYLVPVVLIAIDDEDVKDFKTLIEYCEKNTQEEEKDDSGSVTAAGKACNLVIWANRIDGVDTYENKADPNVASKILYEHAVTDNACVYYEDDDDDKEHPYLQLIPVSAATSGTSYDPTKAQEATDAAYYLMNKINASALEYTLPASGNATQSYRVNFSYSETAYATAENLINLGAWQMSPAMGMTMIGLLIGFVLLAVVLALFQRVLALASLVAVASTTYATFATFALGFTAQFNIAALIALVAVALLALFSPIYTGSRLKDELYKGRTLKKAAQEAGKKATWPTIDASVIAIIIGIFLYVLGGSIVKQAGVTLVLGGVFAMASNLILTKILYWLLCNDSSMQHLFPKWIGVDSAKVPNLMKDEKQTYFGLYQNKDFAKGKKWAYIVGAVMMLAGIGTTIGFGVANGGNIYNDASYRQQTSVLRIDVRSDEASAITVDRFSNVAKIYGKDAANGEDLFHQYTINGKVLASYVTNFTLSSTPRDVYETPEEGDTGTHYYYFYYVAELNKLLTDEGGASYTFESWDDATSSFVPLSGESLSDLVVEMVGDSTARDDGEITISFDVVRKEELRPYVGEVCLGVGVGLAVAMAYLLIRYRPSRGIAVALVAASSLFIALSFFVMTRIAVSPVVAVGLVFVETFALVGSLFFLGKAKELFKDNHDRSMEPMARRELALNQAVSYEAGTFIMFALVAAYLAIDFFAFGPMSYGQPFLLALIGIAFASVFTLVCLAPMSNRFAKLLGKIHFRLPEKKKKSEGGNLMRKKKGAEPEEAIFIGIND